MCIKNSMPGPLPSGPPLRNNNSCRQALLHNDHISLLLSTFMTSAEIPWPLSPYTFRYSYGGRGAELSDLICTGAPDWKLYTFDDRTVRASLRPIALVHSLKIRLSFVIWFL